MCTIVILPLPPPSLKISGLFFNGIGHGLRCKRMIAMEFFADNRQQRGYGRLLGAPLGCELFYVMIVRLSMVIIGKTGG